MVTAGDRTMGTELKYRLCPKCELNYITGYQTECAVCKAAGKPYGGGYCEKCGSKCGQYKLCWSCHRAKDMSLNEKHANASYRTDNGMVGSRSNRVCRICGAASYSGLCGRCYMASRDTKDDEKKDGD